MSFFATPLGVRVGAGLAAIATAGGGAAAWLPNSVYLDKYKDVVHFYKNGLHFPMGEELKQRGQSVVRDVKLHGSVKDRISFFHVSSIDPFYAGSPYTKHGAIVGLPVTFTYKKVEDVPVRELGILTNNVTVAWDSPAGTLLKEALVFPETAQKFAIAQQIYMASSNHMTLNSIASAAAVLHTYLFSRVFNRRMPNLPFAGRCVGYALTALLCSIGWVYMVDLTTYSRERDALDKAMHLGPDYAQGAIEYYERLLVRNKALRVILGKAGASRYTARGNLNTIVRTPHMPLSACLDRAKEVAKELSEVENASE